MSDIWKERAMRHMDAVMETVSDGAWHTDDEIREAVLGCDYSRNSSLEVSLCLDILRVRGRLLCESIEADGLLKGFRFRIPEATA